MFSGIIDRIGVVAASTPAAGGRMLEIDADGYWEGLTAGASVAIDGVCLTLTRAAGGRASFDVVAETLRCSTLGDLRPGDRVNLQKCMIVGERVDGHFVQGHVDAIATVAEVEDDAAESRWWFDLPEEAMKYIALKGSVAIDGISLTVAAVRPGGFAVALIPTTLARTTIRGKKIGAKVNIETDMIARSVVHYLESLGVGTLAGNDR